MAKNLKALTDEELDFIDKNYEFVLRDEYIIVSKVGYNRKVMHELNEPFDLSTPVRKVRISKEAMSMWSKFFKKEYSLIEVQNALNVLVVTCQDVTIERVREQLKRKSSRIKSVC